MPTPNKPSFLPSASSRQRWHSARTLCGRVQGPLHTWLLDKGSLTARLQAKSEGRFHVQLLRQSWHRANLSEARLLGIAPRARVLVREVILHGNNQPWVFARSIFPYSSLQGSLRRMGKFDSRPLGAFLFSQAGMRRGPMEVSRFSDAGSTPGADDAVWGRRSVFYIDNKPLLVSEVFLPEFIASL